LGAIETVRIIKELMEIWPNEVCDNNMAEDCHATSGYAFIINGGAVSWSAKC